MAHDVFVSYSSHDKPTADAACAALEAGGHRCWIAPRDVLPGMDYGEAIVDAIRGCKVMVLVYSGSANTSPQIRREVERAVATGATIIPFRIEDVPMSKSLEYYISSPHWLDALTPPLERHLAHLSEAVGRLLSAASRVQPPPVPPPPVPSRRGLLVAAAVVVLALVAALGYALFPAPATGRVERDFVGRWTARMQPPGAPPITWTYEIAADGSYHNRAVAEDAGTVQAGRGRWRTSSPNGSNQGTYEFLSPNSVRVIDPLGTTVWTRDRAPAGAETAPLAGEWRADIVRNGATWKGTWSVTPQGGHRFMALLEDAGTMEAAGGRFTVSSRSNLVVSGTYTFNGRDALVMNYPGLSLSWTRR